MYTDTVGYCRGGKVWPSGSLWYCFSVLLTKAHCEEACNLNPDCAAYDTFPNVDQGICCLFMNGNTGNGDSRKVCSVKQSGTFVIKITHFELSISEYNMYGLFSNNQLKVFPF